MPTAIILAGPNGAGKTTFASGYFRDEPGPLLFINADEIGRELDTSLSGAARDLRAALSVAAICSNGCISLW